MIKRVGGVGDFFQLPPVIRKRREDRLFKEDVYAFESSAWDRLKFKPIILEEVKRTNNLEFVKILTKVREGICDLEVKEYLNSLKSNELPKEIEPTYLFGRNAEADSMNRHKLNLLNGEEALFSKGRDITLYPHDFDMLELNSETLEPEIVVTVRTLY